MIKDYECNDCGTVFEYSKPYEQKGFPDSVVCESCRSTNTRKKIVIGGIIIPSHMKAGSL